MTKGALHIDVETRSVADLTKVGAYRYAEHPTSEIILFNYRWDDGEEGRWRMGQPLPEAVVQHVRHGGRVVAHNAAFERSQFKAAGLDIKIEQMDCTMARAQAVGLPGALFAVGKSLSLPEVKDMGGHQLMMQMCKPRGFSADGSPIWWDDPEKLDRLQAYCAQDVRTEAEVDKRLPPLTPRERKIWELDQRINDRGVCIDVRMVRNALRVVELAVQAANKKIWRLTNGQVEKVTQAAKIVNWINEQGVPCQSIAEGGHEDLLLGADIMDLPDVQAVVALRAASAKAFKFEAMLAQVCTDGRVRGSLGYAGTIQKRWIGRGVQFHNMKRVETDEDAADVATCVEILLSDKSPADMLAALDLMFEAPLETLSICTRSAVVAAPGHTLVGGDYKNIEGRICAWLAGQQNKLEAFRAYDAGTGPDLYRVTAGNILGIAPEEVTKAQRQESGKVTELSFQFQGAKGAYKKQGAKYGVRLSDERINALVLAWREKNDRIVAMWKTLQDAAIEAVSARGCVISVLDGRIQYAADKAFLYCKLPNGGVIHYPSPTVAWKSKTILIDGDEVTFNRHTVSYWTQHNGRFVQQDLYGGSQTAHIVSGIAREVLCDAMLDAEEADHPLVLTIHDELLCEVPHGRGSAEGLLKILRRPKAYLGDCPLDASTWEGDRYTK
jgi:DNA polymerase